MVFSLVAARSMPAGFERLNVFSLQALLYLVILGANLNKVGFV
jgi:hypothetical protein